MQRFQPPQGCPGKIDWPTAKLALHNHPHTGSAIKEGCRQIACNRRHWYGTGSGSDRAPIETPSSQGPGRHRSRYRTAACPNVVWFDLEPLIGQSETESRGQLEGARAPRAKDRADPIIGLPKIKLILVRGTAWCAL